MAFETAGNEGALNGVTAVDIVPVPGAGERHDVIKVCFYNRDTAIVTITLVKDKGGTDYIIDSMSLNPGDQWTPTDSTQLVVLDATDEKIQAYMSGAPATTQPSFDAIVSA
jgi:hypothetical protein